MLKQFKNLLLPCEIGVHDPDPEHALFITRHRIYSTAWPLMSIASKKILAFTASQLNQMHSEIQRSLLNCYVQHDNKKLEPLHLYFDETSCRAVQYTFMYTIHSLLHDSDAYKCKIYFQIEHIAEGDIFGKIYLDHRESESTTEDFTYRKLLR